jgi:hypothetical protein
MSEQDIQEIMRENAELRAFRANLKTGKFNKVVFTKDTATPRSMGITGYSGYGYYGPVDKIIAAMDFMGVPSGTGPVWAFIKKHAKELGYVSVQ